MDRTAPKTEGQETRLNDRECEILAWVFAGETRPLALEPPVEPGLYL